MYLYILWRKGNLSIFDFEKPQQNGLTTKEMETTRHFLLIFVRNSFIFPSHRKKHQRKLKIVFSFFKIFDGRAVWQAIFEPLHPITGRGCDSFIILGFNYSSFGWEFWECEWQKISSLSDFYSAGWFLIFFAIISNKWYDVNLNLVYTAPFIAELNFRISKMTEFFLQRLILSLFCVQRRK